MPGTGIPAPPAIQLDRGNSAIGARSSHGPPPPRLIGYPGPEACIEWRLRQPFADHGGSELRPGEACSVRIIRNGGAPYPPSAETDRQSRFAVQATSRRQNTPSLPYDTPPIEPFVAEKGRGMRS